MDKKFIIRFYGRGNSPAIPMIQAFGQMQFYNAEEDIANFQTLIIECSFLPAALDDSLYTLLFEAGKTIGFLGITEKELNALATCTGRKLNLTGKNIFIRPLKHTHESDEKFAYTILPDYTQAEVIREYLDNRKTIYHELRDKVFQKETAPPNYHQPPPPTVMLYPVGDYESIYGSNSVLVNGPVTGPLSQPNDSYPAEMNLNLFINAYAFLANGAGGDNNYHLILYSDLSNVFPVSIYEQTLKYSYELELKLTHPGRNINLQPSVPNEQSQTTGNTYGYNIYTEFGILANQRIEIPTTGRDTVGNKAEIPFQPNFASMINQVVFPCIQNYYPKNKDLGTGSKVSFTINMSSISDPTSGHFEMMSYFIIDAKNGEPSFMAELQVLLTYKIWELTYNGIGFSYQELWKNSIEVLNQNIDLVQLTRLQHYNPPSV